MTAAIIVSPFTSNQKDQVPKLGGGNQLHRRARNQTFARVQTWERYWAGGVLRHARPSHLPRLWMLPHWPGKDNQKQGNYTPHHHGRRQAVHATAAACGWGLPRPVYPAPGFKTWQLSLFDWWDDEVGRFWTRKDVRHAQDETESAGNYVVVQASWAVAGGVRVQCCCGYVECGVYICRAITTEAAAARAGDRHKPTR